MSFPNKLNIIGFLPNKKLGCLSTLSRHIIIPTSTLNNNNLALILNETLKVEHFSAIIYLGKDWYAVIQSTTEKDKSSLIINILSPSFQIPWIPYLSNSINKLQSIIPFTEKIYNTPSYLTEKPTTQINQDKLQRSLQKISKYCRQLPNKQNELFKECDLLNCLSQQYYVPSLLKVLLELLQQELNTNSEDIEASNILKDIIYKLKVDNRMEAAIPTPISPIPISKTMSPSNSPTNTPSPKQTMSVNNLLN